MAGEDDDLEREFVRAAPAQARGTLRELLRQPRLKLDALAQQVRAHTAEYVELARSRELDAELAQTIEERLLSRLSRIDARSPAPLRRIVQAACEYYVFAHDADADFDSVAGLDDDAEVANALLFALGEDEDSILIG